MSNFICEVTEVTLNDTVDFDALLMNIKLSHCQLNCHLSMMLCIQYAAVFILVPPASGGKLSKLGGDLLPFPSLPSPPLPFPPLPLEVGPLKSS